MNLENSSRHHLIPLNFMDFFLQSLNALNYFKSYHCLWWINHNFFYWTFKYPAKMMIWFQLRYFHWRNMKALLLVLLQFYEIIHYYFDWRWDSFVNLLYLKAMVIRFPSLSQKYYYYILHFYNQFKLYYQLYLQLFSIDWVIL